MPPRKRDEPKTPDGKIKTFSAGGKAGRTPGLGTRNNTGTKPGAGADRPTQGYGMTRNSRKVPDKMRPDVVKKPDESEGGEHGN